MSKAVISYSSLIDSANEAKAVAKKLDKYAENLNSSIYRKLTNYGGSHTGNIEVAKASTKAKISELEHTSSAYTTYSQDLKDLKDKCVKTDKAVKSRVSQLTATFKKNHGIKNSKVLNVINYCLTSIKNSTCVGRWINNTVDKVESLKEYIGQQIKVWWKYEGGKELVQGIALSALDVVFAACAVALAVIALLSGGAIIVFVAAIVGAAIMIANARMNYINEFRAYNATHNNNDPALGARRSAENTVQDTIRRELDSKFWHNVATGIDVVNFVSTMISVIDGAVNLFKNGFKWATGSTKALNELKVKDILSKSGLREYFNGIKRYTNNANIKTSFSNIKNAIKLKDWNFFKKGAVGFGTDFFNNLKDRFGNWGSLEKSFKSLRNISSGLKSVVSNGLDFGDILKNIVLPGTTAFSGTILETGETTGKASVYDFYTLYDKGKSLIDSIKKNPLVSGDSKINSNVLDKLNENIDINIAVPEIYVPEIEIEKINIQKIEIT